MKDLNKIRVIQQKRKGFDVKLVNGVPTMYVPPIESDSDGMTHKIWGDALYQLMNGQLEALNGDYPEGEMDKTIDLRLIQFDPSESRKYVPDGGGGGYKLIGNTHTLSVPKMKDDYMTRQIWGHELGHAFGMKHT